MRAARIVVGVIAAAALLVPAAAAAPQRSAVALTPLESGVLVDINAFRRAHHLSPLKLNAKLGAAAMQHTQEMAADGYFAHESHDGSLFWKRIQSFYGSTPWRYWSVGENLLWSSPDVTPAKALQMWLASPEHRANLMNPHWREIGVAAVHVAAAPGVFKDLDVTIVTTDFGVRY
ncbi:MAG: CAP domain-containing protein [Actinomycetota bacterium]